jgi:xanthine dehydrogenase accessory factor
MGEQSTNLKPLVLVRGGGDLASGVILRLHHSGFHVVMAELHDPLTVRRLVSFSSAVHLGTFQIEDVEGVLVSSLDAALKVLANQKIAIMIDPEASELLSLNPIAVVDARMLKTEVLTDLQEKPMLIGLGPGFTAGKNCHVVIETNRGPYLGRVYWHGSCQEDTQEPEKVMGYSHERVLRSPAKGILHEVAIIGDILHPGDLIATVDGKPVNAPFSGVLRGLVQNGLEVTAGMKIGDIDPRCDPQLCRMVSDKALAIGGGVLEALLSNPEIRMQLGKMDETL